MSGKYVSRGKYRRVSTGTPTASSESESNWNEAILGQGAAGSGSQGTGKDTDLNACELYELQRRCFSCCNVVLQQRASVENGKRMMLMQQPKFKEHPLLKAIMERVSRRGYMDISAFVDDFTRLIDVCVGRDDRHVVLEVLDRHVERTGQVDPRRPFKATFQGFPHPIIEDMMAHSALARKKLPPGALSHVSIDVGRFFAQAYGLGLSKGAKFCGKPSQENVFLEQRKKKEAEAAANGVTAKVATTGSKAQKKGRLAGNQGGGSKKKSKVQTVSHASTKPTRCLRTTRRQSIAEGGAPRMRPLFDSDDGPDELSRSSVVQRRVRLRSKVHCHHLQGQLIEMDDPEYGGKGFLGRLMGTVISCNCGCGATMSGTHWLIHNGGRYSRRQSGFPYRFLRLAETKENVASHFEICDCHEHLCDTCNSWEAPGAPMTECYVCHTSVHATEECAVRFVVSSTLASIAGTSTMSDPNVFASVTAVTDSRGKVTREGARSKAANSNSNSGLHGEKEEGNINSPSSLAWRRPSAEGTPCTSGTAVRSRSSRRKNADQGGLDDPGAHVLIEGDPHDVGTSKAESVEGRKGTGRGAGKAAVRDEVVVWKCQACARPGTKYPSWN